MLKIAEEQKYNNSVRVNLKKIKAWDDWLVPEDYQQVWEGNYFF